MSQDTECISYVHLKYVQRTRGHLPRGTFLTLSMCHSRCESSSHPGHPVRLAVGVSLLVEPPGGKVPGGGSSTSLGHSGDPVVCSDGTPGRHGSGACHCGFYWCAQLPITKEETHKTKVHPGHPGVQGMSWARPQAVEHPPLLFWPGSGRQGAGGGLEPSFPRGWGCLSGTCVPGVIRACT